MNSSENAYSQNRFGLLSYPHLLSLPGIHVLETQAITQPEEKSKDFIWTPSFGGSDIDKPYLMLTK